jgi:hypothetical protein
VPHVTGAIALYASAYQRLLGSSPSVDNIKSAVLDQGTAAAAYTVSSRPGTIDRAGCWRVRLRSGILLAFTQHSAGSSVVVILAIICNSQ